MRLSEQVERKFVEELPVAEWEVLSHDGWRDVYASNKTIEYEVYRVTFEDGQVFECADNHILIADGFEEVFAKDSLGRNIKCQSGIKSVVSVEATGVFENMYDLSVDGDNLYYTSGILSHNTTTTAAIILWHVLFKEEYTVALLANKMIS